MTNDNSELKTIDDLKPAPYNPRKISEEAVSGLAYSLEEFGDISGITWNKRTGHLVSGHQRVNQLKRNGAELVDGVLRLKNGDVFPIRVVDWDEKKEPVTHCHALLLTRFDF